MHEIPLTDNEREYPNEYTEVERPLLVQLAAMGWQCIRGDLDYPQKTFRERFRDVILMDKLRDAIRRINRDDDGNPYLDDVTIDRAIRELLTTTAFGVFDKNRELTDKLNRGVSVEPLDGSGESGQRSVPVKFIELDPEHLDRNEFVAINQFRVDFIGRTGFVIPDIVLFVNGIPLVVIECKSPRITEPMQAGIDQLLRYSNNRPEVEEIEGVDQLFLFNQLLVSTWFYEARVATLGAQAEHYELWKECHPATEAQVRAELEKPTGPLKSQEILAAGMLRPAHLLDIVRNFILFMPDDEGHQIKIVAGYQQFRAVHKALHDLLHNRSRLDGAAEDERGGIIWHTQGSGKSVTMVFLIRKMRTIPKLRAFKIVVVTDRTQLEEQLQETAALTGETIRPNKFDRRANESASDRVKRILAEDGPDLVFCMIQKNQDFDADAEVLEYEIELPPRNKRTAEVEQAMALERPVTDDWIEDSAAADEDSDVGTQGAVTGSGQVRKFRQRIRNYDEYPVLNQSVWILLLIDECHRTQAKTLHANLMKALPNAAKIGLTGTPVTRATASTLSIFRRFIDKYRMGEAEADKRIVKVSYEGRVPRGVIEKAEELDLVAKIEFDEYTDVEQQTIMQKYATEKRVLEAPKLIAAKARDMLRHYAATILPSGFKAQVVATSRRAAVRYQQALEQARDELVADLAALNPALLRLDEDDFAELPRETQYLVSAFPFLDRIRTLEFAAEISHDHNDPPTWRRWTDKAKQREYERKFKLPFEHRAPDKCSPLAFLCVQNMLLTGFNAPIEQVMYLDRRIYDHDLLQAIARVNRKRKGKKRGYVVDYVGIARAIRRALEGIDEETSDGGQVAEVLDEIPRLEDRHSRVMQVFTGRGINDIRDVERCVDLLEDEQIRAEFINYLSDFLASLGIVMPRPDALPYLRHAKILGFISRVAANLYRDDQLNLLGVEPKVRRLIDQYIAAQGIDHRFEKVDITDIEFNERVARGRSSRARASEMLHALRHHIRIHTPEDPEFFRSMSEKLADILRRLQDKWDELERVLAEFIRKEAARGRQQEIEGLDPKIHAPFFGILKARIDQQRGEPLEADAAEFAGLVQLTTDLVSYIQSQIRTIDFWRDDVSQDNLETWVYNTIRRCRVQGQRLFASEGLRELASQVVDLARHRHRMLVP